MDSTVKGTKGLKSWEKRLAGYDILKKSMNSFSFEEFERFALMKT